jgi:hypothetical protein
MAILASGPPCEHLSGGSGTALLEPQNGQRAGQATKEAPGLSHPIPAIDGGYGGESDAGSYKDGDDGQSKSPSHFFFTPVLPTSFYCCQSPWHWSQNSPGNYNAPLQVVNSERSSLQMGFSAEFLEQICLWLALVDHLAKPLP